MYTVSYLIPYFSIILVLSFSIHTFCFCFLQRFIYTLPIYDALKLSFLHLCLDFPRVFFLSDFQLKMFVPFLFHICGTCFPSLCRFFERSANDDSGVIIFLIMLHLLTHLKHSLQFFLVRHFQRVFSL